MIALGKFYTKPANFYYPPSVYRWLLKTLLQVYAIRIIVKCFKSEADALCNISTSFHSVTASAQFINEPNHCCCVQCAYVFVNSEIPSYRLFLFCSFPFIYFFSANFLFVQAIQLFLQKHSHMRTRYATCEEWRRKLSMRSRWTKPERKSIWTF